MSPVKHGRGTKWGKLTLVENPTKPVTQGFKGPVCDKVPRIINLQGKNPVLLSTLFFTSFAAAHREDALLLATPAEFSKNRYRLKATAAAGVAFTRERMSRLISTHLGRQLAEESVEQNTYIGRGKKSPIGGAAQTTIDLGYISSGHCCFSLRRKDGGGIEAVVKDTSSNGTYVDAVRVPKGTTRALTTDNQVALYYPMGATALGRPILYNLELYEQEFENAIKEGVGAPSGKAKRSKSSEKITSNPNTTYNNASNGSISNTNANAQGSSGSGTSSNSPVDLGGAAKSMNPPATMAKPGMPTQQQQQQHKGKATAVPTLGPTSTPAPGGNEWLDSQVKMRQEAVAKATRELEADRERMANDARSLRSQLEVAVSRNKQLAADRNALQVGGSGRGQAGPE
ncbi:unnamed protein product [Ectocarpus sp. CCAP 1310/34]|nr:unnamed protein product [Ectocarpus sp. CCAP 1310/34]